MTDIFGEREYTSVRKRRTAMIWGFSCYAALLVAANVLVAIFLRPVSYGWGLAANILLTVLLGASALFYFELPFRLVNRYYKLLKGFEHGLRETGEGVFLYYEEEQTVKDGVEFYGLVLEEKIRGRAPGEHRILIEHSHPRPDLHVGDKLRYETQGNVLLRYEVTERIPDELLSEEERLASERAKQAQTEIKSTERRSL